MLLLLLGPEIHVEELRVKGQKSWKGKWLNMVDLARSKVDGLCSVCGELMLVEVEDIRVDNLSTRRLGSWPAPTSFLSDEDADALLVVLERALLSEWYNQVDLWMHDADVKCVCQLDLGSRVLQNWYHFEHVIVEHQNYELLVVRQEKRMRRLTQGARLVPEEALGHQIDSLGVHVVTKEHAVKIRCQDKEHLGTFRAHRARALLFLLPERALDHDSTVLPVKLVGRHGQDVEYAVVDGELAMKLEHPSAAIVTV